MIFDLVKAACVMVNVSVNGVPEFGMTFGVWLLTGCSGGLAS